MIISHLKQQIMSNLCIRYLHIFQCTSSYIISNGKLLFRDEHITVEVQHINQP